MAEKKGEAKQINNWYKWVSVIGGALIWGGWAYYVNVSVSLQAGIVAGLVQGTVSALMTLIIMALLVTIAELFATNTQKLLFAPLLTALTSAGIVTFAHFVVGTPEIIKTITPGATAGYIFAFVTCVVMLREQKSVVSVN